MQLTRCTILLVTMALGALSVGSSLAANTGDEVVVVYNKAVPVSKEIADHYASRRSVPKEQVIGFDLPAAEMISRADFEAKLQQPLWKALTDRKLLVYGQSKAGPGVRSNVTEAKVRYAVLCYGVPLKIIGDPMIKEEVTEKLQPALQRNEAAVDSELAALPVLDLKHPITGVLPNPAYGATNVSQLHPTNGVLMVARLDAPQPTTAKKLVDRALHGEEHGLWGRAYFDTRGVAEGPYSLGDLWIKNSAEAAGQFGLDTQVDVGAGTFPASTPMPDIAIYFGWYDQDVSGPFTNEMAEFTPGAIAYHLHSYSARSLRTTNSWWAGALIEKGAAFTMGCTEEPYLQITPDVNMFIRRLLFVGWSVGEAAYSSQQALSWQVTIVGDPLYSPYAKSQKEHYARLEASGHKDIEWSMMMWVNLRLAAGAPLSEIEAYYSANPKTKTSAILQERLANIYKSLGKLSSAVPRFTEATKLPATPLQRLRIDLSAASLLSSWGRTQEAYDLYKGLLEKFPDYPGKKEIYDRLAQVAERLNKGEEASEYQRLATES